MREIEQVKRQSKQLNGQPLCPFRVVQRDAGIAWVRACYKGGTRASLHMGGNDFGQIQVLAVDGAAAVPAVGIKGVYITSTVGWPMSPAMMSSTSCHSNGGSSGKSTAWHAAAKARIVSLRSAASVAYAFAKASLAGSGVFGMPYFTLGGMKKRVAFHWQTRLHGRLRQSAWCQKVSSWRAIASCTRNSYSSSFMGAAEKSRKIPMLGAKPIW